MSQFQETFKRYETKYILTEYQYKLLRQRLQGHMCVDSYGKSTISNIYFDTPDSLLIRTSLEKPVYKEKLRLRSYGVPNYGDTTFIELKKKYDGIVYKRRESMELAQAENYLYGLKPAPQSTQILREIDWFLHYYKNIIPAMYISYDRIAMYGMEDKNLRLTFDTNILWRTEDLHLQSGVWGTPLLKRCEYLMEIKIPSAMPLWFSHILDELRIYPVSFSKYGKAYEQSEQLKINKQMIGEKKYA